ncbi:MAG: hypothetical protein WAT79_15910 [Saprospiraceae bacterium]
MIYWTERNSSTLYAEKLILLTAKELTLISKNPEAFKESEIKNIRESTLEHFSIYYKFDKQSITVMAFWDNRQDPELLFKSLL